MKKTIMIFIACCLVCGLFAGCSSRKIAVEEDVIVSLRAGFLYTSAIRTGDRNERAYLNEREKTVSLFIKKIEKTAELSSKLNKEMVKYENNLLGYIESIKDMDDETSGIMQSLTDRMIAYKVIIKSLQDETAHYLKAKTKNEGVRAIINTYMLESVCESITIQNEYISWLADATAAVCSILEASNPRRAAKLMSSSGSLFDKKIAGNLGKLLHEFNSSSEMYSYIRSADYYASGYFLEEAEKGLGILKEKEYDAVRDEADELEALFNAVKTNIKQPGILKTVAGKYADSPLIMRVMADDDEMHPLEKGMLALEAAKAVTEGKFDKESEGDTGQLSQKIEGTVQGIAEQKLAVTEITDGRKEQFKTVSADAKVMTEETWEAKIKRLAAVSLITITQNSIKNSAAGIDAQYDKIIKFLVGHLKDHISKLTPEQQKDIEDLIDGDLETILGDKKTAFVNYILNTNANTILDTFNNWKNGQKSTQGLNYTRNDLVSLISSFGFDIEDIKKNDPKETDTAEYGNMKIVASYDLLKRLSASENNESIMMIVYGWSDPLDYTKYEKRENRDKDGNLSTLFYLDENGEYAGWYTRIYGNSESCRYYFPGEKHRSIEINRGGSHGAGMLINLKYTDENEKISSGISFASSAASADKPELQYIWSTRENQKDGLNMQKGSGKVFADISSMGKILESYVYVNDILTEEMYYSYIGDTVTRDVRKYYDNGERWTSGKEIGILQSNQYMSFRNDGPFYAYNKNGNLLIYAEYKEGQYNGKVETYYEDGTFKELITYKDGKKDGKTYRNYPDGKLEFEGAYKADLREGTWCEFLNNGDPKSETGYKDGLYHGIYHIYATNESGTQAEAIHVIGQYEENKMNGIWIYGYHNTGYVEKYLYENGIMVWKEIGNTRTYFNADGSIKSTEKIN